MKKIILLGLLCFKSVYAQDWIPTIVGGHEVSAKSPLSRSVVAILIEKEEGEALCTGSIIASHFILTAAHCVDDNPQKMNIVFDRTVKAAKEKLPARAYLQNPNWNHHQVNGEGDLALIYFEGDIPAGFSPVTLADKNLDLNNGQKVIVEGYGVVDGIAKTDAGRLRQTKTEVIGRHSETELELDGTKSSVCFGDSGGPAFVVKNKELIQWGVASSVSSESCNSSAVHTEVMSYLDWINKAMMKLSSAGR